MKIRTLGVAQVSGPAGSGGCSPVALPPPPVSGTRTETVLEPAAGTAALRGSGLRTLPGGKKVQVVP